MHDDYVGLTDSAGEEYPLPARRVNGETNSLECDFEDDFSGRPVKALSASLLQSYDTCPKKGKLQHAGADKLQPTAFTATLIDSGNEFERRAVDALADWLPAVEEAIQLTCPFMTPAAYRFDRELPISERLEHLRQVITEASKTSGAILTNVPLMLDGPEAKEITKSCDVPFEGEIDVLIWTGEVWVIGDIKCSESGRASYANQITLYYCVWSLIFPGQPIHPVGFIAHCSRGQVYNRESSSEVRLRALRGIQIKAVRYRSFQNSLHKLIAEYWSEGGVASFRPHCIECGFRHRCYSEMVLDGEGTHISLFPATKDEIDALRDGEDGDKPYPTIEALLEDLRRGEIPTALLGTVNEKTLHYVIGRAEAAIRWHGFSSLRWDADFEDNYIVGAWEPAPKDEKRVFYVTAKHPGGTATVPIEEATDSWRMALYGNAAKPAYFIGYDTRGTSYGSYFLRDRWPAAKDGRAPAQEIALLDIIRDYLHVPFTSLSLPEIFLFLREVETGDCRSAISKWRERVTKAENNIRTVVADPVEMKHSEMLSSIVRGISVINEGCKELEVGNA